MAQDREELLPCPFCGGPAKAITCMGDWTPDGYGPQRHRIVCGAIYETPSRKCAASLPSDTSDEAIAAWNRRPTPPAQGDVRERAVMVCPQCDGEGSYADGVDEAACSTDCTRCGTNGWIVDLAALPRTGEPVAWINLRGQQGEPAGEMIVTAGLADGSEVELIRDNGNIISHSKNVRDLFAHPVPPQEAV